MIVSSETLTEAGILIYSLKLKIASLEQVIGSKIIGQKGPIRSVCSAIRLRENGWIDPDRPLVMLFLGSSGVGKTELAKQIALYSHNRAVEPFEAAASIMDIEKNNGFIRIDMTEFQHSHTVANLFGEHIITHRVLRVFNAFEYRLSQGLRCKYLKPYD